MFKGGLRKLSNVMKQTLTIWDKADHSRLKNNRNFVQKSFLILENNHPEWYWI